MFTRLPLPIRPNPKLPVFWLGVAAASLALVCLLLNGQPHASTPPRTENPFPEHVFPPTFVRAVPEVGLMSEVRESGPYLRAAAAAWPGDSGQHRHF